jgi:hypothetical protein
VLAFTSVYVFELSLINGLRAKEIRKTDPGEFAHRVVNVGRLARIFAKSSLPNILANVSVFAKKMSGSHSVSCWGERGIGEGPAVAKEGVMAGSGRTSPAMTAALKGTAHRTPTAKPITAKCRGRLTLATFEPARRNPRPADVIERGDVANTIAFPRQYSRILTHQACPGLQNSLAFGRRCPEHLFCETR